MKEFSLLLFSSSLLLFFLFSAQAQTYTNPVIPGDFPDPSVIRVGEDFYATATTGGWSPHFPILHSKDLVNWKIVGAVLTQKPQWAKGDFWAPEMIAEKGRFFVYYTARRDEGAGKKGTLCVAVATADKPDGIYTDHGALICQEMGSIDAFFVRDENDKPFLVWKEDGNDRGQPTWIYAAELDENGTKLKGKPKKLFRNTEPWERHVVEGSFIVRRNGWFYHFYSGNACCGRACDYALGVARARKLLGPWEKYKQNPILAANGAWQCPGHGSIVTTDDGRDFLLYHAYRKRADAFNIGREALLDKIEWTSDGWATINGGRGPSDKAALPFTKFAQKPVSSIVDEFNDTTLEPFWSFPLNMGETIRESGGFLTIAPTEKQSATEKFPEIVVAERTISGTYTATAKIDFTNLAPDEAAGISAYSWRGNAVGASIGSGRIFVWRRENGNQQTAGAVDLPKNVSAVYLRMRAEEGEFYRFAFSTDGVNWRDLSEKVTGSHVEGARVALIYNGKNTKPNARFDWLRVEAAKEN